MDQETKLSERRVALTMPADELEALDAYCTDMRRFTGNPCPRAEVIREAVRRFIIDVSPA